MNPRCDIAVVGGGNAALCAAITAAERGAKVAVFEAAPKPYRGGNSRHTRNFRCMHPQPLGTLSGAYDEEEYYQDLLKVTEGQTDESLARLAIQKSEECYRWMEAHGAHFQPALSGTLSLSRTNAFFLGGGKALMNAYYRAAESLGVKIFYNAKVTHLNFDGRKINRVEIESGDDGEDGGGKEKTIIQPRAVVVASGGFQSNIDWLAEAWGPAARNFLIRGTPYNRGVVLKDLLDQGLPSVGDATQCHAVAVDGRAPQYDGGIVTRLDCVPFSIVVNKNGQRFYDEGEDVWPKRYAIWGRLVAAQPDQVAYAIIDSKSLGLFMPPVFPPAQADSIAALAEKMNLCPRAVTETAEQFNAACPAGEAANNFHPTELDGLAARNIRLAKTNWARPINQPPFYGYELKTGVTFTYLGLRVDENAQVQGEGAPVENLWAAGETMAGSILGRGYLAGFGMTLGMVFGRIAGEKAAAYVN